MPKRKVQMLKFKFQMNVKTKNSNIKKNNQSESIFKFLFFGVLFVI